jgi:hypothetical protein
LFTSPSEDENMTSSSSVSPSIILSCSCGPSSRKTSQTKLQNVADRNMRLPNFYLPFITLSNGRYYLVTYESHQITLSMNWKLFVGCYVGSVTMSPLKRSRLLQRK